MGSQRARPLSRARSWDRSSRSGSVSEGHQSPEDEGESKKKVDWYDAQWTADSGLKDTGGAATGDRGPQRAKDAEALSCMSSFICLAHVRVRVTEPPHSAPQKPTVLRRPRPTPLTILPRQVYPRDSVQGVPTNTTVKPNVARATEKASQEPTNLSATGELDLPLTNLDLTGVHQVLSYGQDDKESSDEFLQELYRLGEGAGGVVHKVRDKRTDVVMARKAITIGSVSTRQVNRELTFMSSTSHRNIVKFYAAYISPSSSEIKILMEFCEGRSLEAVWNQARNQNWRIGEREAGSIAEGVSFSFSVAPTFLSRDAFFWSANHDRSNLLLPPAS